MIFEVDSFYRVVVWAAMSMISLVEMSPELKVGVLVVDVQRMKAIHLCCTDRAMVEVQLDEASVLS